jgi:hypothetical protein
MAYGPSQPTTADQWLNKLWQWIQSKVLVVHTSTSYTVHELVYHVRANATSGAITITLPAALARDGRLIQITKTDSSANAVTVARSGSDTINGAASYTLSNQYDSITVISDGSTSWEIASTTAGNYIDETIINAKGDLIAGTADNTADNLTVGANNTLLMADSAQTMGMKWANEATVKSALNIDLDTLSGLSATGLVTRTAADTYTGRTLSGGTGVTITNGDGVSGNPTVTSVARLVSGSSTAILGASSFQISPGGTEGMSVNATQWTKSGGNIIIVCGSAATTTSNGYSLSMTAGNGGSVSGNGSSATVSGGSAVTSGTGGQATLKGGNGAGTNQAGGNVTLQPGNPTGTGGGGLALLGLSSLTTSSTYGFPCIPAVAGTPTGTPSSSSGYVPMVYDTTNDKLYIYNGGWKSATFA